MKAIGLGHRTRERIGLLRTTTATGIMRATGREAVAVLNMTTTGITVGLVGPLFLGRDRGELNRMALSAARFHKSDLGIECQLLINARGVIAPLQNKQFRRLCISVDVTARCIVATNPGRRHQETDSSTKLPGASEQNLR